jgi:hypothetical protein
MASIGVGVLVGHHDRHSAPSCSLASFTIEIVA